MTALDEYLIYLKFLMQSKRRLFGLASDYGMSGMQGTMLLMLKSPAPMQTFKNMFNCDASNVTGLADGLEQKGYLIRYESEQDRRIKMLKLTPKGEELRKSFCCDLVSDDTPLFSALDPEERETLFKLFKKVVEYEGV